MQNASSSFEQDSLVTLTDPAATKIHSLIEEEDDTTLSLRVYVTGGGCSGFQYNFDFAEKQEEGDLCVKKKTSDGKEVRLLIDPISLQYLAGANIDYRIDVDGEQFVIQNPNAKTTCGCGSSFDAKEK